MLLLFATREADTDSEEMMMRFPPGGNEFTKPPNNRLAGIEELPPVLSMYSRSCENFLCSDGVGGGGCDAGEKGGRSIGLAGRVAAIAATVSAGNEIM